MRNLRLPKILFAAAALATAYAAPPPPGAAAASIGSPGTGTVRALVVGIDKYFPKQPLKGAVADAEDIAASLRKAGVTNLVLLRDLEATRSRVLDEMKQLADKAKEGDLVILSFAGHGGRIKEMYPNTKPDHMDEAYILAKFNETVASGAGEVIAGPEIKHWLGELDKKGVNILFIADTCHGGGLTRAPVRRDTLTYRGLDSDLSSYAMAEASAYSTPADASRRLEGSFKHLTFIAAADPLHRTPEVQIQIGSKSVTRGALSYAVARAIEGSLGRGGDGAITRSALFEYARQEVLNHSDRQVIFTQPEQKALLTEPVFRSLTGPAQGGGQTHEAAPVESVEIRVFIEDGDAGALSGISKRVNPFVTVPDKQNADVIWNAAKRMAFVLGDVVAHDVDAADIPGVADRVAVSRLLARLGDNRPQTFHLLPDAQLHHKGEVLSLEADGVSGKYLVAFNITGDGVVQYLFPYRNDTTPAGEAAWSIKDIEVKDHFGADQVVVISSPDRLPGLEKALQALDKTNAAGGIPQLVQQYLDPAQQVRIGLATIVTAP